MCTKVQLWSMTFYCKSSLNWQHFRPTCNITKVSRFQMMHKANLFLYKAKLTTLERHRLGEAIFVAADVEACKEPLSPRG